MALSKIQELQIRKAELLQQLGEITTRIYTLQQEAKAASSFTAAGGSWLCKCGSAFVTVTEREAHYAASQDDKCGDFVREYRAPAAMLPTPRAPRAPKAYVNPLDGLDI